MHAPANRLPRFLGDDTGWRITAVCHNAEQLLGVDLVAMRAGAVSLTHFVTDSERAGAVDLRLLARHASAAMRPLAVENTLEAVRQSEDGCLISLRNVTPQGAGVERGFSSTAAIVAKLQVLHIPMIDSPVYIMRFRNATVLDRETAALLRRAGVEADIGVDDDRSQDSDAHVRVGVPVEAAGAEHPSMRNIRPGAPESVGSRQSASGATSMSTRLRQSDPASGEVLRCPFAGDAARPIDESARRRVAFGVVTSGTAASLADAHLSKQAGDSTPRPPFQGTIVVPSLPGLGSPVLNKPFTFQAEPAAAQQPGPRTATGGGGSVARSRASAGSGSTSAEPVGQALRRSIAVNGRRLEATLVSLQRAIIIVFALTVLMK